MGNCKTNYKNTLQKELNITTRRAVNAPWYITNKLKMDILDDIIHKRRNNVLEEIKEHENVNIRIKITTARKRKNNIHKGVVETHEDKEE